MCHDGRKGMANGWFKSFLTNRMEYISIVHKSYYKISHWLKFLEHLFLLFLTVTVPTSAKVVDKREKKIKVI